MEKRFEVREIWKDNDYCYVLCDNERGETMSSGYADENIINLLNEQDKKIKELKETIKLLTKYNEQGQSIMQDNERLNKENQKLKQSQNSKAIEVLERAKIEFETYYADNIWNYPEWIDNQITELRGGENE